MVVLTDGILGRWGEYRSRDLLNEKDSIRYTYWDVLTKQRHAREGGHPNAYADSFVDARLRAFAGMKSPFCKSDLHRVFLI